MNKGDVCLVTYPYLDGTGEKLRPVVIVSEHAFQRDGDVVVLPISSTPDPKDPYTTYIDDKSPLFDDTGLDCASSIKWTKPFTVNRRMLRRHLGTLGEPLLGEACRNVVRIFG